MQARDWRIIVRDRNRQPTEDVDDYVSIEAELNLNAPSRWTLTLASNTRAAANLIKGAGIIVLYRDEVVFSGVADHYEDSEGEDGPLKVCRGIDDTGQLGDRWASPDPAGPPYADTAYDKLENVPAETAMHHYVNKNAGPGATIERRLTGLTMGMDDGTGADGGRGKVIEAVQVRFDPLMTVLQGLALSSGDDEATRLRFQVIADMVGGIAFCTFPTEDRRDSVVFTRERETMGQVTRTQDAPTATRIIAAGSGEGTAREFVEQTDSTQTWDWNRLVERFYDARNSDPATMLEEIAQRLGEGAGLDEVTFEPVDTDAISWLSDYDLGDRVSAVLAKQDGGYDILDLYVSRIDLRIDGDGVTVRPTLTARPIAPDQSGSAWVSSLPAHLTGLFIQLAANIEPFTRGMFVGWHGAEGAHPSGWAPCDGDNGTLDMRNRFPIGAGDTYSQGQTGGSTSASLAHTHTGAVHTHAHRHTNVAHTHPGGHSHGAGTIAISHVHAGAAHTHPGSHSHGISDHNHLVTVSMGTGSATNGTNSIAAGGGSTTNVNPTNHGHTGTPTATGNQSSGGSSTQSDSNAHAADYASATTGTPASVTNSGSTDSDSNAHAADYASAQMSQDSTTASAGNTGSALGSTAILPPFIGVFWIERTV